jgi:hypothetical protein
MAHGSTAEVRRVQSEGFVFEEKPVYDWNHVPVGTVSGAVRDPKTRAARQLVLRLTPEAQTELGAPESVELPASFVFGVRRDSVTLDRSIHELKKIDFFTSVIKK